MKRGQIEAGRTYRGSYGRGLPEHCRRVDSIEERAAYSTDTHIVTYSRLYKAGWSGGFTCTLHAFAAWALAEAEAE